MSVSKSTISKVGHHTRLRDMMSQTYPTYAYSSTNHARHFIDSWHILLQLEARVAKITF